MRAAILAKADHLHQLRRAVPAALVPAFVKRRLDKLWVDEGFRRGAEAQMHHLLDFTERAPEVPELAYGYAEQMMLRSWMRWHPRAITRQPVRGIEWLTTARDPDRGVVMNFMHHARYDGMFASLARAGASLQVVMSPLILGPETSVEFTQHRRVMARGAEIFPATGGTDALATLLRPGSTVVIVSDVPGQTPVTFLGRKVLGSFGAARIAAMTNSQVVLVTAQRDEAGEPYLQVHPPLEPADYSDPRELLDAILRGHEPAILAWPEALEVPRARFGAIEDQDS